MGSSKRTNSEPNGSGSDARVRRALEVIDDKLELVFKICELRFVKNLSGRDIAKKLKVSEPQVSRLLTAAREAQLVRISIHLPEETRLAKALSAQMAKFGIRRVLVTRQAGGVGYAAARFFEEEAKKGATVVLDGGNTVDSFVLGLTEGRIQSLKLVPIAADPPSYHISSYEAITKMSMKYWQTTCFKLPHLRGSSLDSVHEKVRTQARRADFVFLGTGPWQHGYTALDFIQYLGLEPETIRSQHPDVVGMCGYCAIDANGNRVRLCDQIEERLPRALEFEDLRRMAKNKQQHVVLLAASAKKLEPLTAILKARLCNTLILDSELGQNLLDLDLK